MIFFPLPMIFYSDRFQHIRNQHLSSHLVNAFHNGNFQSCQVICGGLHFAQGRKGHDTVWVELYTVWDILKRVT